MCIASPIRRVGGVSGGTARASGDGVSCSAGSGSMAVCAGCAIGFGTGCAAGAVRAGAGNTGGGVTRGAAKADAVGERNESASSAGAAGA